MESDQSRKHTSLRALKGDLKQAPAEVLSKVTEKHVSTGAAVSTDPQSSEECIGSSLRYDDRLTVPLPNYARSLGPFFSKLPRELRDKILSELIISGNARFMSASRAMHSEGKDLIYQKGIFRINYGYSGMRRNVSSRTKKIADQIQNLLIRANMKQIDHGRYQDHKSFFRPLAPIMDSALPRGICSVYIETEVSVDHQIQYNFLWALRALIEFHTVVLRVETNPNKGYKRAYFPDQTLSTREIERAADFGDGFLDLAQGELELFLGKCFRGSDSDGVCLIFHPRLELEETVRNSE